MKYNVEIFALVYKSLDYLHFITKQLKSDYCNANGWYVGVRLILNDATDEVKEEVKKLDIPYTIFENPDPSEYYINRVYRAYNHGIVTSKFDNICMVNSDNAFTRNWLDNLLRHHNGINIPSPFLVESGKRGLGMNHNKSIKINFGTSPKTYNAKAFEEYSDSIRINMTRPNGLYVALFEKQRLIDVGLYPEGNIYNTGVGKFGDRFIESGDMFLFRKLQSEFGMNHITVLNSIMYHIQEGEKDD